MLLVRNAHGGDLPQLSILLDGYRQFYKQASDVDAARAFLLARLDNCDSVILVAEGKNEQLLGFCQLYPIFTTVGLKKMYLLNDLYVNKQARRLGVARALIKEAQTQATEHETAGLLLETGKTNKAGKQLYPSCGFELYNSTHFYFWKAPTNP